MVRRGAYEREAESNVDGVIEGQRLDRDQRLVVIHAQGRIIGGARPFVEQRVGGKRTFCIDPLRDEPRDSRRHDRAILLAERTGFAGMRVEPGNHKPRMRKLETRGKIACNNAPGFDHEVGR